MVKQKHTTFRFDPEIKSTFKNECFLNGIDMTEAIESLMVSYINICKNRREAAKKMGLDGKTEESNESI
jgi:hypothetical protein